MRSEVPTKLEYGRITQGPYKSGPQDRFFGAFFIQGPCGEKLQIISSEAWEDMEWEHVSVSTHRRTPNWREMCFVKDLFWGEDETVIQFHPPKSEYVNNHEHCLHLWRHRDGHKTPPRIAVGIPSFGTLA